MILKIAKMDYPQAEDALAARVESVLHVALPPNSKDREYIKECFLAKWRYGARYDVLTEEIISRISRALKGEPLEPFDAAPQPPVAVISPVVSPPEISVPVTAMAQLKVSSPDVTSETDSDIPFDSESSEIDWDEQDSSEQEIDSEEEFELHFADEDFGDF